MDQNEALRQLLLACRPTGSRDEKALKAAWKAIDVLDELATKEDPVLPDGPRVVAQLIAEGYCNG